MANIHFSRDVNAPQTIDVASAESATTHSYFLPLDEVTLPTVETAAAAYYLNRKQQTLRIWACHEDGPIRPIRINGRLHWKTADLRRVLGVSK